MTLKTASLFLAIGLLFTSQNSSAQQKKLTREEKREVRKAQLTANYYSLDTMLNMRTFVLEADYLQNSQGQREPVVSSLNFIRVEGDKSVLQTGANASLGYNGVGGVTAEGTIDLWELNKNPDNLSYTLHFSLLSQIGHFDVIMFINSDMYASATITGLWPGKLTWSGRIMPLNMSRAYKGQNTI